jgi:dihydroorotase
MSKTLIKGARIVNEGKILQGDVLIHNNRIERVDSSISDAHATIIEAGGHFLLPGMIDDQVHFREPGLTHKADIRTESRAAVAGGITSFMEMPNTVPNTLTQELLEEKYAIASRSSIANYSFYMGTSNDNVEEILKTDSRNVCGVKIFMGSSTGNMLVDKPDILEAVFSRSPMLIATHCEDEGTVKRNLETVREKYGEYATTEVHPIIRDVEACYLSSSFAVGLAKKHGTRLHVLHISTAKELSLFDQDVPVRDKHITAEACIHHLWFSDADYATKGNLIKWNPAIKSIQDRDAIRQAVINGRIDVIATDHAPHTLEEKSQRYYNAPAGGPLVQHALPALFDLVHQGIYTPELVAHKCSHAVADCFRINERGYIREGYFADLTLIDTNNPWTVTKNNIRYKSGWSPFEGTTFKSRITHTWVNGNMVFENGIFHDNTTGNRMTFEPR